MVKDKKNIYLYFIPMYFTANKKYLSKDLADFWWSNKISSLTKYITGHIITLKNINSIITFMQVR